MGRVSDLDDLCARTGLPASRVLSVLAAGSGALIQGKTVNLFLLFEKQAFFCIMGANPLFGYGGINGEGQADGEPGQHMDHHNLHVHSHDAPGHFFAGVFIHPEQGNEQHDA